MVGSSFVASVFRHHQLRMRMISLNLLAQAVDVRLQRMRRDTAVVSRPCRLRDKGASTSRFLFLRGEVNLGAPQQHLGCWFERERANRKYCVLSVLVLSQVCADARQQHRKPEGLDDV